ncbi:hypothetical protein PENTCL1PPCAC_6101, partial [Pristionchus entomophagus]
ECLCAGRTVGCFIRLFAVLRLLITILSTLLILVSSQRSIDEIKIEDRVHLSRFHFALALVSINILITSLLWAGDFAEIKNSLLPYALSEIPFSIYSFAQIMNNLQLMSESRRRFEKIPMNVAILIYSSGFFVFFSIFLLPFMILRFHSFLRDRN